MNLSSPAAVASLLRRHNLEPRKRFGQNFLIDRNTLLKIVNAGQVRAGDCVCEIGSGLGVLTVELSEAVGPQGRVVTVELDSKILPALQESIAGCENVVSIFGDALELPWPDVLDEQFGPSTSVKFIANIPYNITTPLITMLLQHRARISGIVLLVQKEVAERMVAPPGSSAYGAISVFAQYHATVEIMGIVSRRVFLPPPDVDSAILRLTPHEVPPVHVQDEAAYFRIVRAAFGQRRKALPNALAGDPALGWSRERAVAAITAAGIDPQRRGETLSLQDFAALLLADADTSAT